MKDERRMCWIPVYGAIIFFFIITIRLARIDKRSIKMEFCYFVVIGLLGSIGMLMAALLFKVLHVNFGEILFGIIATIFVWPLITLPILKYAKKAEEIINEYNKNIYAK